MSVCKEYSNQKLTGNNLFIIFILSALLLTFAISLIYPPASGAADPQKKLTEIQKKLKSTLEKVKESEEKERSVAARIEDIEKSIQLKEKELKNYDRQISQIQSKILNLLNEITLLSGKLEERTRHLNERLRALYRQQYGGHALILISATDYQDLIKKSRYISLIAYYDSRIINQYSSDLKEINFKKGELESLNENLQTNKNLVREKQKALQTDRIKKDKLLASIRNKRKSYEMTVKELEESSEKLIDMINRLKEKALPESITGKGFTSLKGRLNWPIAGQVLIPFGKYKDPEFNITVIKNGIEIKSNADEKPQAIAGGRVVYADWFKGYGLLLIIDHGSGYHSLYGNLSEIFLNTGDILIEGTVVGKTGMSSLLNVPTLYFEIRYKGKPVDPMQWLQRKSATQINEKKIRIK